MLVGEIAASALAPVPTSLNWLNAVEAVVLDAYIPAPASLRFIVTVVAMLGVLSILTFPAGKVGAVVSVV